MGMGVEDKFTNFYTILLHSSRLAKSRRFRKHDLAILSRVHKISTNEKPRNTRHSHQTKSNIQNMIKKTLKSNKTLTNSQTQAS